MAEFMNINMPWCDTQLSVNVNTGQVTKSNPADRAYVGKLEIFQNTSFTSDEVWVALYDLDHNTRWEMIWAVEENDKHWAGKVVLINMATHLPDETENWPVWMKAMYEKVTEIIMDFSPLTREWLQTIRIGVAESRLRHLWAAATQYERNRRIFGCTSKGPTEEQAVRESREIRTCTKNLVQRVIWGVKDQLTRRGKENHKRRTREWLEADQATRQQMQEGQQQVAPTEMDISPPIPPLSHVPEGAKVTWLMAVAQAKRALQVTPDVEMAPEPSIQEGVKGQILTQHMISDDEEVLMSRGNVRHSSSIDSKPVKRHATRKHH